MSMAGQEPERCGRGGVRFGPQPRQHRVVMPRQGILHAGGRGAGCFQHLDQGRLPPLQAGRLIAQLLEHAADVGAVIAQLPHGALGEFDIGAHAVIEIQHFQLFMRHRRRFADSRSPALKLAGDAAHANNFLIQHAAVMPAQPPHRHARHKARQPRRGQGAFKFLDRGDQPPRAGTSRK